MHLHGVTEFSASLNLLEVEDVAVEVREDVPLEELLLAVEGELLGADGAYLPVALHVLLEGALLEVWREDHFAQRAALVDVRTADGGEREQKRHRLKNWEKKTKSLSPVEQKFSQHQDVGEEGIFTVEGCGEMQALKYIFHVSLFT